MTLLADSKMLEDPKMHVASLWQHPVKSMIGVSVDRAELTDTGMAGDRGWAVRDEERGGIRGAKKIGELMQFAASYNDDAVDNAVRITLPDGSMVGSADPNVHDEISRALGRRVTLMPLQPAADLDHYRRGRPDSDDVMTELRAIFGREIDEPLPDLSIFPPEIMEFESPPGTYLDAFPLLVMTTSALRSLGDALPGSNVDVRRFRPNIVIDTGDQPGHPEFAWTGQRLLIGSVELEVIAPCPRCVMVTRQITPALAADRQILRHIVADLDQNLGVYARAVVPGPLAVGTPAHLTAR